MWKTLVNIVKRCLRNVLRKPAPKRETRVQNPPEEYDERAAALEYAHKLMTEFLEIYHQWKAGTLPPQLCRQPRKPPARPKPRPRQIGTSPDSVRKTQPHAAPVSDRTPKRRAPAHPKFLRPRPLDSPFIFSNVLAAHAQSRQFHYEIATKKQSSQKWPPPTGDGHPARLS